MYMTTTGPNRTHKECGRCREIKPVDQYNRRKLSSGQWGVHSYCKPCNITSMREWSYGITEADWVAILASQGGVCAICGAEQAGGRGDFHIDHDHKTGVIRGLLCHGCNVGLGNFGDDVERMQAAIAYLRKHQEGGQ